MPFRRDWFLLIVLLTSVGLFFSIPAKGSDGDYRYYKIGVGRTVETTLFWGSASRGYYVFPTNRNQNIDSFTRKSLNKVSDFMSTLSREVTGRGLKHENFSYGFEGSAAWVADERITNKIDLTIVGKGHYWTNKEKTAYFGLGGGFAYNELQDENRPGDELNLGGHLFFTSELEAGKKVELFGTPHYITFTWAHRSNAGLESNNTGINALYFSMARRY